MQQESVVVSARSRHDEPVAAVVVAAADVASLSLH